MSTRGRPRRIEPDAIAQAVLDMGLENSSMRRVAARLGVSLPGLYHHVKNQDELLALATRRALQISPPPVYQGQGWPVWLRSYAHYIRDTLSSEPALLEKFINGAADHDGEIDYVADALDALQGVGLEPEAALDVWAAVTAIAMGSVSEGHRERVHSAAGRPWLSRVFGVIARREPGECSALRAVAQSGCDPFGEESFDRRLSLLFGGIAVRYGLSAQ